MAEVQNPEEINAESKIRILAFHLGFVMGTIDSLSPEDKKDLGFNDDELLNLKTIRSAANSFSSYFYKP